MIYNYYLCISKNFLIVALKVDQYNGPEYREKGKEEDVVIDNSSDSDKPKRSASRHTNKHEDGENRLISFFADSRLRVVLSTIMILFAGFLLISGISYLSNGAADQSAVEANGVLDNADSGEIKNFGGPLGAALAELFFNKGFGIGAFCLIYMIAALGLKLIGKFKYRVTSTVLISCVGMITLSSVIGFIGEMSESDSFFYIGGAHGHHINAFINSVAGVFGCIAFNIILIVMLIALTINSLRRWYGRFNEMMANYRLARLERRHREEEERRNTFDEAEATKMNDDNNTRKKKSVTEPDIHFGGHDASNSSSSQSQIVVEPETIVEPEEQSPLEDNLNDDNEHDIAETQTQVVATINEIEKAEEVAVKPFDPTAELSRFKFPPVSLLQEVSNEGKSVDVEEQEENKERITKTLGDYGITIRSIEVCVGPTVTLYEIIPAEGVRISKIKGLEDDIALSLAALGIRIIAPIPGKGTIGIEVPNKDKRTVSMRSVIESKKFQDCKYELPIALGCTISNDVYVADLAKMPHILVAGATGQGKSVGLNAIVTSLLYKKHPSQLKFVMVDPKMVEFSIYEGLENHYLAKMEGEEDAIITDMHKAVNTLRSLVAEMENRLVLLRDANVRNIKEYNEKFIARRLNPEKGHRFMPYIVVVIDELADLIMNIGRKEVEVPIARITQKARAVGIHMILATQRPSTDIITGVIKANCPGRIAFRVAQMVDSRTILDRSGAQQLIGRGDMLISYNSEITRVQCAFVDTPEVEGIVNYVHKQVGYDDAYILPEPKEDIDDSSTPSGSFNPSERDSMFEEVAMAVVNGEVNPSTSSLQRRYSIGYNRAGRIMDQLEASGVVSAAQGGKPRLVLMDPQSLQSLINS